MSRIALPGDIEPCIMPPFDSDAFIIGVDNHASCCMDANVNHFTNLRRPKQKVVTKGITDGLTIKVFGTVHWNITDDRGRIHHVAIDDSAFVPNLPHALLSPQHWSQQANDHFPMPHGTIMEQYSHECKLYWGQKKFVKTIPLDPKYNTPRFYSASGSAKFRLFNNTFETKFQDQVAGEHLTFANIISDSEGEEDDSHDDEASLIPLLSEGSTANVAKGKSTIAHVIPQELPEHDDIAIAHVDNPQAELLRWHYRLNHLSFGVLQTFAKMGLLPRRLTQAKVPKCSACIFGAMHKQPWHSHAILRNISLVLNIIAPGQCVSVDQLVLPEPGFIAQLKGRLTRSRVTAFVDHFS